MISQSDIVKRGALAGAIGATALVVWFLIIDLIQGRPFFTPRFLVSSLFGMPLDETGAAVVIAYTVAHYAVFLLVGVSVAAALQRLPAVPSFLLGVVLGVFFFDVMFYASVVMTGQDVVVALGWPQVMIGSLAGGISLMAFLRLTETVPGVTWQAYLKEHPVLREGLVAGLLGATAVAVWFLIVDAFTRRVFFTPAALGSAIFYGARGSHEVEVTVATVFGYSVIHFAAFAVVGLVVAALLVNAEREAPLMLGLVLLFVTFEVLFIGLLAVAASWILDAVGWWSVAIGNVLAACTMGVYLWRQHPALIDALRRPDLEEPQ